MTKQLSEENLKRLDEINVLLSLKSTEDVWLYQATYRPYLAKKRRNREMPSMRPFQIWKMNREFPKSGCMHGSYDTLNAIEKAVHERY